MADEVLRKLSGQNGNDRAVISSLVELRLKQGRIEQALALCDKIIDEHLSGDSYVLRARVFASAGRIEKARQDFTKAIDAEPMMSKPLKISKKPFQLIPKGSMFASV